MSNLLCMAINATSHDGQVETGSTPLPAVAAHEEGVQEAEEQIQQTERFSYRTKDGKGNYVFELKTMLDGTERAYILSQPTYQGRRETPHSTHRCTDASNGSLYVDWYPPVCSRNIIKEIAKLFADCTQEYIKTGKRFGPV